MHAPLSPPEFHTWRMSDGYVLHGRVWQAGEAAVRDVGVLYLHGIQSHGGWFEWSASVLAEQGLAVVLPDRRGSGLNAAARGDVSDAVRWVDDIAELSTWMRRTLGVRRVALLGVSWGGKLALAVAARDPALAVEICLVAPGVFPAVDVGWRTRVRIGGALFTRPERLFPIPLSDPALFTDNPAGRAFISRDPLKLSTATARFLYQSALLDRRLRRLSDGKLRGRFHMLLAGQDRIIRNGLTKVWLGRVASHEPEIATFWDAGHTLEFEADRREYEEALITWGLTLRVDSQ